MEGPLTEHQAAAAPAAERPRRSDLPDGLWRRGDGSNLVGVPAGFIAGTDFNDANRPLHIAGVREMNVSLFRMLERTMDEAEAGEVFTAYMATMFGLASRPAAPGEGERRRYRTSYLRLLRGWAYDSNAPEGAVLKGWVESRFGLFPTYHREPLRRFDGHAWGRYVDDKMGSRFHNNAIFSQLDLLYEYAQWALRRGAPDRGPMKLFRGVNDFDEHPIVERIDKRRVILRLNNLVSFTSDRAIASCFGDRILQTEVPLAKVLFIPTLLPRHPLKGEDEILAIGGDYLVRATYW